ncbi:MAG: hypothetical protein JST54_10970 [Deltaproteobacteria bacterium]|nr:hypothetical protein [Deltaproteobacteria bacterium]
MNLRIAALLIVLVAPAPMVTVPDDAALQKLFAPAWAALPTSRAPPFWSMRVTPRLPDAWPAPKALVVFAYPVGMDPGLSDAERIAKPFARATFAPGAAPKVESLSKTIDALGPQGFRPINEKEQAIHGQGPAAQAALAALPAKPDEAMRAYYCQWAGFNGVIVRALPDAQLAFFAGLGCPISE